MREGLRGPGDAAGPARRRPGAARSGGADRPRPRRPGYRRLLEARPALAGTSAARRGALAAPLAAAAAGGAFHFLGFVGFGVWPLALVSLAPLWHAIEATRARSTALRDAALAGFVFGQVAHAGGYAWLWRIVDVFLGGDARLGAALWLAHSIWFALPYALAAALTCAARRRGWPIAVAGVAPFVAVEWLTPSLFPVHYGNALVDRTALVQIVDLGGPLLATALVALVNAAVFETWRWLRAARAAAAPARPARLPSPPLATWAAASLAVALAWGYGAARIHALEARMAEAPALRVGLVQGNLGVLEKRGDAALVHRRYLEQTRELLAEAANGSPSPPFDLVVWPETVYSRGLQLPLPISGRFVREDLRVPLLFGGATVEAESGRRVRHNGALLVGADGVIRDAYAKNLLIPLAEYVPFAEHWPRLADALPHAQEFSAATDTPPLALGPWRISTPICYEAVRPAFVRRMVLRADPHLIATLANDAWFGDSQEPRLHLAVARLRAVEHHLYLVRATNSGISAVVDPLGRVVARTGLLARENLRATLQPLGGRTLYARAGDWPGWLAAAIAFAALAVPRPARGGART